MLSSTAQVHLWSAGHPRIRATVRSHPFAGRMYPTWTAAVCQRVLCIRRVGIRMGKISGQGCGQIPEPLRHSRHFPPDKRKENRALIDTWKQAPGDDRLATRSPSRTGQLDADGTRTAWPEAEKAGIPIAADGVELSAELGRLPSASGPESDHDIRAGPRRQDDARTGNQPRAGARQIPNVASQGRPRAGRQFEPALPLSHIHKYHAARSSRGFGPSAPYGGRTSSDAVFGKE